MAGDEELPWNVSRCNRLLRPLSSKLAKLRKELELPRTAHVEPRTTSSAFATKHTPQKTTNFTRPANKPRGFEKARDPDWRPGVKGVKRTYGGRKAKRPSGLSSGSAEAQNVARPGEIAFTPLIARMGKQMVDSPIAQESPLKKHTKHRSGLIPTERTDSHGLNMSADIRKLTLGMLEAYANILNATREKKVRQGTGTLMNACLRKLPAYIELEEHFAELDQLEEEELNDRDVANEIYEDLETRFEQRQGQGWRPFKQVVRAHATAILCKAFADGILTEEDRYFFHRYCLAEGAFDEAEELLVAALPALEPLPFPTNVKADLFGEKWRYMSDAKAFVDRSGRHRFLYDLLEHMVAHELLPLEWLATASMRSVWDRLVRTISEGDHRNLAACSRFLETCMMAGMGLPDERLLAGEVTGAVARRFVPSSRDDLRQALNTTFSSLFTVLCSISLVNSGRNDVAGKAVVEKINGTLDAIVIALTSRSDIDAELRLLEANSEDLQMFAQRACWAIFSCFLAKLEQYSGDDRVVTLSPAVCIRKLGDIVCQYSSHGANSSTVLATLPLLVSASARGTGRIWKDDGFCQLQRLVLAMSSLSGHRLPHKLWTLKRIALEAATEFANDTDDMEHLKYASDIEKQMRVSGRLVLMPTPRKTDTASPAAGGGFRWEDGIGEWVACTPFVKQTNHRLSQKPVRALELLPTPVQSEDEDRAQFVQDSEHESAAEPIMPSSPMLHSSPIKKRERLSRTPLGKRTRASSPMVMIPAKRMQITPPDTPVEFYPELPEDIVDEGKRRLRRTTTDIKTLRHRLKTQRSRSSLEGGLRDVRRVSYAATEDAVEDDSEDELSFGF